MEKIRYCRIEYSTMQHCIVEGITPVVMKVDQVTRQDKVMLSGCFPFVSFLLGFFGVFFWL